MRFSSMPLSSCIFSLLLCLASLLPTVYAAGRAFEFKIDLKRIHRSIKNTQGLSYENIGIQLPLPSGFAYQLEVDWGDGTGKSELDDI
jgi:hypothetical protein